MAVAAVYRKTQTGKREKLLERFESRIRANPRLDRTLVSFQADRKSRFFSWFKYKEAFSADLVRYVISEFSDSTGTLLDPFAGVGTALLVARSMGIDSIGIELLPIGVFATEARLAAESVKPATFSRYVDEAARRNWGDCYDRNYALRHIPITKGAFPGEAERAIAGYRAFCDVGIRNSLVRRLFKLACLSVLESVSYTRKDGQYLRWDHRASKPRVQSRFDKGHIPGFRNAVRDKLRQICADLTNKSEARECPSEVRDGKSNRPGIVDLRVGSCLDILPTLANESIGLVFTSPPYCNRYDYTRTYALELVYLGLSAQEVKALRQEMLSCTVENRTKVAQIRHIYEQLGKDDVFREVEDVFQEQAALHEVLEILEEQARNGQLNNANIPRMVRNYFFEMCFVIHELVRVLQPGGRVVMVNDNVRYKGEEIPVDLVLSDFASSFGLRVEHIWTLARGKGNSSQQMGKHGRAELRKCVYVWRKC